MQFRYGLVVAWVLATTASILVAFAAVASVRTAITDPPSALLLPGSPPPTLALPELPDGQMSTVPDPEVADGAPTTSGGGVSEGTPPGSEEDAKPATTSSSDGSVATTTPPEQAGSTTAPQPPSTTTTPTTEPPADSVETYETGGGWVTVRSNPRGVFLESASPKPGWTVETDGNGPEHFTVVFKGDDEEVHFKVEFYDGRVSIDVDD